MIYEKLPETVEAIQYDNNGWSQKPKWLERLQQTSYCEGERGGWLGFYIFDYGYDMALYNHATDYVWKIDVGCWLIYEPDREIFYVYDDETFKIKFKKVS